MYVFVKLLVVYFVNMISCAIITSLIQLHREIEFGEGRREEEYKERGGSRITRETIKTAASLSRGVRLEM